MCVLYVKEKKKKGGEIGFLCKKTELTYIFASFFFSLTKWLI